jgi:hypothetical protein
MHQMQPVGWAKAAEAQSSVHSQCAAVPTNAVRKGGACATRDSLGTGRLCTPYEDGASIYGRSAPWSC